MGDLPSDEEASASYQYLQGEEDDEEEMEDEEEEYIGEVEGATSPPPPPPPPMRHRRSRSGRGRRGEAAPQYPTTIEVAAPRSRIASRAKQRVHATHSYTSSFDSNAYSESSAGTGRGELGSAGRTKPDNYESFPAPSVNNSLLESSVDKSLEVGSQKNSVEESPLPLPAKKASRGQVLVHYHPQLGDEGYESTLLDAAASEDKYSRVSRAMNAATDRRPSDRPPKHVYPTNRGMHTRAIDDLREEEMNRSRNRSEMAGGNDEYNNAATRQIRRRVFRVAIERGMHDERRKKIFDADQDVGPGPSLKVGTAANETSNGDAGVSPLGLASPGSSLGRNGFRFPARSADSVSENEGDMPLSPKSPATPKTPFSVDDSSIEHSLTSPPAPPSQPPSYRTLVHNLIAANEPEKLVQMDRVMEKYAGREEELIKKLDLRYRRRRAKREKILEDLRSVEQSRSKEGIAPVEEEPPKEEEKGEKDQEAEEKDKPLDHKKIEDMTSPSRIHFIKVEGSPKERSAIMAMQSWDKSEGEIGPPPEIQKKPLPAAISDLTKADVPTNIVVGSDDDDDNSGFIGIPKVAKATVENLGNQVMKERLLRGRQKEEQIAKATGSPNERGEKKLQQSDAPESPNIHEDYKLKTTHSFGDGISVITMETKATMERNRAMGQQRAGGGEAVYSFDEMKRPPNSITVEDNSGSGKQPPHASKGVSKEGLPPKIQRVVPEMETREEKELAAEASADVAAKIDNVEARIEAQRQLREEEEAHKSPGGALMVADDERVEGEEEAKEADTLAAETMKTVDVEETEEGVPANPIIIESILSSFDEEDKTPKAVEEFRKKMLTPIGDDANGSGGEDNRTISTFGSKAELDQEVARIIAEKESRFQAEKAVALMKAQRELEAEKRARFEAEAARLKAERELEELKVGRTSKEETDAGTPSEDQERAPLVSSTDEQSEDGQVPKESDASNAVVEAEFARLKAEQELERLKLEKMAEEAEAARVKAEEELERLRSERAAKEAEASELVQAVLQSGNVAQAFDEGTDVPSLDQGRERKASSEVAETARLEAEAARIKAEQELEKLKQAKAAAAREEEEEEANDLERTNSEQDEVENFRRRLEADAAKEGDDAVNDNIQQKPSEEAGDAPAVENKKEEPLPIVPTDDAPEEKGDISEAPAEADGSQEIEDKDSGDKSEEPKSNGPGTDLDLPSAVEDEPKSPLGPSPPAQELNEEEAEAQIHHIARVTFEGDQSKGQLSFTTGSKVEAHSNQRGPWWLGRCGGRTGWFPANAVVPASEFLSSVVSSPSDDVEQDKEEEVAQLSGDDLNKVYDLIRNPSDPEKEEDEDDSDDESSPAKMRWLGGGSKSKARSNARDHSPPPSRIDPSEMAGLTQRLYGSDEDRSRSEDEIAERSQSPLLIGQVEPEGKPTGTEKVDETQTNESPQPQPMAASKTEPKSTPQSPSSTKAAATKESPSPEKPKPTPGWRAAKDPKSGLIYYYHTETRETTWKRPRGYKSSKAGKGTPRSPDSKESKGTSKGILGFLSKMKKAKPEAEKARNVSNVSPEAKTTAKKNETGVAKAVAKEDEIAEEGASLKEVKPNESETELPVPTESPQKEPVQIQSDRDDEHVALAGSGSQLEDVKEPQWKTLDDASSASGESDHSDMPEETDTSLFSKTKTAVGAVGKLAGKITEKLTSPNLPYETLDDRVERPQDQPDSSDGNHPGREETTAMAANDEQPAKEDAVTEVISDNDAGKAMEEEPKAQAHAEGTTEALEPTTKETVAGVEKRARDDAKRKNTEWRSAIDAASGRTYFYKKGSQKVTWKRPKGFVE